jgi:methyl-branched lipid omega-hydroxylase
LTLGANGGRGGSTRAARASNALTQEVGPHITASMPVASPSVQEIDISQREFWAWPWADREAAFRTLRRERPIAYFPEPQVPGLPSGPGFYAITRHADILEMSARPDVFCSGQGATSIPDLPTEMNDFYGSMINMDDPRHQRLRGLVSRRFTPRMVQRVMENVERVATRVIDDVIDQGTVDFVPTLAARLPLIVICDMMGIPESEHDTIFQQSNIILSGGDPEYIPEGTDPIGAFMQAGAVLAGIVRELAHYRATHPVDDLTSALANGELDGGRLTDDEIASFFILLAVAGNETTRTAISHGLVALQQHPDQRDIWRNDFAGVANTAVEEIVRWATPVIFMRRTVTQPVTVSGHTFETGDKVALHYNSANRDEAVFPDGDRFDVRRDPNPHVGFGGPGPHFCLGAHLARREILVMFRELFRRLPDLEITGAPDQLRSAFINGIKHLPVRFRPGGSPG